MEHSKRWPWRWLRRLLMASAALCLTLLATVFILLRSSNVAQWVVYQGASFYEDMIPGHLEIDSVQGAFAKRLSITGIRLLDAKEQPLVALGHLSLGLDLERALHGELSLGTVELADIQIFVPDPSLEGGGFSDLAPAPSDDPETDDEDPETGPFLGPSLPSLDLDLQLRHL